MGPPDEVQRPDDAGGVEEPALEVRDGVGVPDRFRRLWTPHRLAYITSATSEAEQGCPFCRIPTLPDGDGLVVARGATVYAVLNLHPYNPGTSWSCPTGTWRGWRTSTRPSRRS